MEGAKEWRRPDPVFAAAVASLHAKYKIDDDDDDDDNDDDDADDADGIDVAVDVDTAGH
jgi:hypothetical protein